MAISLYNGSDYRFCSYTEIKGTFVVTRKKKKTDLAVADP